MALNATLDRLAACLARLPGIGRRSAERMAVRLAGDESTLAADLIAALQDMRATVRCCSLCGCVTDAGADPCRLCTDPGREGQVLCVVEEPLDILALERSGAHRGRYHALGGPISPMKGSGPEQVRLKALLQRVDKEAFSEVILALSTDVEGDATASLIAELLAPRKVRVSRLAFGLPAGSGIGYSDPVTLVRALRGRQAVGDPPV